MDLSYFNSRLFLDIVDVLIVVYLMYLVYKMIKGTMAINIFLGVVIFMTIYWLVGILDLKLLKILLSGFVSVGVLILVIIFQPEIRRFLLMLGGSTFARPKFLDKLLGADVSVVANREFASKISESVLHLASSKTGALILLTKTEVPSIIDSGTSIDAHVSAPLLESIFFKNSPLHDGATIIRDNRIIAASCILPVSENKNIPKDLGLRHRAGIGATENSNLLSIIVSEETGEVSIAQDGKLKRNLNKQKIENRIIKYYSTS